MVGPTLGRPWLLEAFLLSRHGGRSSQLDSCGQCSKLQAPGSRLAIDAPVAVWTSVGYTAWDEASFKKAERGAGTRLADDVVMGVSDFSRHPLTQPLASTSRL